MLHYNNRSVRLALAAILIMAAMPALALTPEQFRGAPTLVIFWRSDCAPCVREREVLPAIATAHPKLRIELVSLDSHNPAPPFELPENTRWVAAGEDAEHTLQTFGDAKLILPFSVYLRTDATICDTHYGILGTMKVDEWIKQC